MVSVRVVQASEKALIDDIVTIHIKTFEHFFLTFMNRGFLRQMYRSYCEHSKSELLVAMDGDTPVGFLAYSMNLSGLYSYMLKHHLFSFGWFAFLAFLKKPSIAAKLFGALRKPTQSKREGKYVKLSSIGVDPDCKAAGIGSMMIDELKKRVDFSEYDYIALETDAENNDLVNDFYRKNQFSLSNDFVTPEGRVMNEYRYCG